jgi:hypothetical protein
MTEAELKERFSIGYYRWAGREWEREIRDGYPLLRSLPTPYAGLVVDFLENTLSAEQRDLLVRARRKKFHPLAAAALGEELTAEEKDVLARFEAWSTQRLHLLGSASGRTARERKPWAAVLKERLDFLGPARKLQGPLEWTHTTEVNGWIVTTWLDLGGRFMDVSYGHDLADAAKPKPSFQRFISLLSWLGLSSATKWNVPGDDIEPSAETLVRLCRHFLAAIPEITAEIDLS